MKTIEEKFELGLVLILMIISVVNTVFLRKANVIIAEQKIEILEAEQKVYDYLNTIAWDSSITIQKQHVTGITRYYSCETVKKEIEKHTQ